MANGTEKFELVIEVKNDKANADIKKTNKSFDDLEKQAIASAKKASGGFDGMGVSISKLGESFKEFAQNPMGAVQGGISSLLTKMGPLAVGLGGIATAVGLAGLALFKMAQAGADAAEQLDNATASTGMMAKELQSLKRLGVESGLGDLSSLIEKLNVQLGSDAGGDFTEAIIRMNIATKDGAGAIYYLEEMRKKYAEIPNATKRAEQGAADFGRRLWHEVAPLVMNSQRSITGSMDEISKSGAIMGDSQLSQLRKWDEAMDSIGRKWEAFKNQAKIRAMEMLTGEGMTPSGIKDEMRDNPGEWEGSVGRTGGWEGSVGRADGKNTLEARARAIAKADAIASGTKEELIPLTMQLNELEKQFTLEKSKQSGLKFDEARVSSLASQIAKTKELLALDNKKFNLDWASGGSGLLHSGSGFNLELVKPALTDPDLELDPTKIDIDGMMKISREIEKNNQDIWDAQQDYALEKINNIKDAAGHIFDDLMAGSKNIWSDLLNTFKNMFLAPVRMAFQNIAVGLFSGGQSSGMGSMAGGMAGIAGSAMGGPSGVGTPSFVPGASGGSGWGGLLGGFGNLSGIKSMFGIKDAVSIGQSGSSITKFADLAMGAKLSSILKSPGAMMAGGLIGLQGLQQGGALGAAMSTGGLAMSGYGIASMISKTAGPWGALIGAGLGLVGGLINLFKEKPEEKMRKKIKSAYGVDISDKSVLKQFVQMAQSYGGNFDMLIRTAQAREMIELYAMSTGQNMRGNRAAMSSTTLVQSGGGLYQGVTYSNGMMSSPTSAIGSVLGGVSLGGQQSGNIVVNITVPGAKEFFEKETVQVIAKNPRTVASANTAALKGNFGRSSLAALTLRPGMIAS